MKNTLRQFSDFVHAVHLYLETIPDRLYPFTHEVEGIKKRGIEAYQKAKEDAKNLASATRLKYRITIYRGVWHLVSAILFMVTITFITQDWLGSDRALYIVLFAAIAALVWQEFLLHPKRYGQSFKKGVFDVATWVVPVVLYLVFVGVV